MPFVRHYELTGKGVVFLLWVEFSYSFLFIMGFLLCGDICCVCVHHFASAVCASVSTVPVFDSVFVFLLMYAEHDPIQERQQFHLTDVSIKHLDDPLFL